MVHSGEVSSVEKSFLQVRNVNQDIAKPTHAIKDSFIPLSMEPKDFGVIIRKVDSVDGKTYYTIKGSKNEIFEIVVNSGGVVNRGQLIGGRGGE